jgi:hypothetical protein
MKLLSLSLFLFITVISYSQTGKIKLFSEVQTYTVSLDDKFVGEDLNLIDSIEIGVHYLKVTAENKMIFSELITVFKDSVTIVLLKTKHEIATEIKPKAIEILSPDMKTYNAKYLRIKENTKFITKTESRTDQYPYVLDPGKKYEKTNSTSTSIPVNYLTIVSGTGNTISHYEFAQLINDSVVINLVKKGESEILHIKNNRTGMKFFGALALIGSAIYAAVLLKQEKALLPPVLTGIFAGAIYIGGHKPLPTVSKYFYTSNYLLERTLEYNQNLKKELNLPLDYEPLAPIK